MTKDRTAEFFSAVAVKSGQYGTTDGHQQRQPLLSPPNPSISMQRLRHHTQFTETALGINRSIQNVLGKLEKLTKLAKSKTMFDDRPVEVQELSHIIKKDLAALNERIAQLQAISSQPQQASSKNGSEHAQNVVLSLQSQLANLSSQFTKVLETRSTNMKAQRDRREQFGVSTGVASASSSLMSSTVKPRKAASGELEDPGHVSIDLSFQQMALAEQNDRAQLDSRNMALQGIEATINELGSIYGQLAHMVAEQGEAVQRIDFNIEDVSLNVQRGQAELLKYLRSVSSNRWLMVKVFAVLIMFVIFYALFLAK